MNHNITTSVRMPQEMIDRIIAEGAKNGRRFSEQARIYIEKGIEQEASPMAVLGQNLEALKERADAHD